ncbi:MAG TPA: aryl-sulfate sulfotransferase [Polyangia bacterium]
MNSRNAGLSTRALTTLLMVSLVVGGAIASTGCAAKATSSTDGSGGQNGSGGQTGSGGQNGSGGQTGSGGQSGSGGQTGSGGQSGSGGRTGSGGQSGSGGRTGSGGQSGSGGQTGSGGQSGSGGSASGGTGAGGNPTDPGVAPASVDGLKIDPNPNSVLSCFVSWTTDKAADSTVQFGQGSLQWEISDATLTTTHKVLVIGMKAQLAYMIKAISANGGGSVSATGTFTTGTLPAQIPLGKVMINDSTRSQAGWTLMNVQKGDGTTGARSTYPPYAVMYDSDGQPVWYYVDGTNPDIGGAVSTVLTDKGVLIGPTWNTSLTTGTMPIEVDFAGNTVWQCSTAVCGGGKNFTHHASKLPNGDYMLIEYITANNLQSPFFREVSPSNQIVWSLDYGSLVPPPAGSSGDWCHANSISVDIPNNAVYANCRWVGLLKTTYQNPTRQWLLQGTYTSTKLGDFTFSPTSSAFSDTHDPEIHDDGTICFFDNGGYGNGATGGTTTQFHSRAVEYQVDETKKTATLIWEFPGDATVPDAWYTNKWYTPFWGDVDRLPNGNHLIAAGIRSTTVESRVFEVTKDDRKVVWEFRFPPDYGVYRADRIVPPLVHPIN